MPPSRWVGAAGVADHDQLGVVPCRQRDQLGKLAVADHARLVDHEHAAGWQVVDLQLVEHAGDRPGGDVRTLSSTSAARPASAQPTTWTPVASNASRHTSRAKVLPTPAAPSTTTTPAELWQTVRTIDRCSAVRVGRAAMAVSVSRPSATPTHAADRCWAVAIMPRSMPSISGVV